jgi:hypothetical protein
MLLANTVDTCTGTAVAHCDVLCYPHTNAWVLGIDGQTLKHNLSREMRAHESAWRQTPRCRAEANSTDTYFAVAATSPLPSPPPPTGSYFKDLAAVLKAFPNLFSDAGAAATKAGLATTLTKQDFGNTLFLPTNAAFKKAKITVADTPKVSSAVVYVACGVSLTELSLLHWLAVMAAWNALVGSSPVACRGAQVHDGVNEVGVWQHARLCTCQCCYIADWNSGPSMSGHISHASCC